MKKIFLTLCAAAVTLAGTGCSSDEPVTRTETTTTTTEEHVVHQPATTTETREIRSY